MCPVLPTFTQCQLPTHHQHQMMGPFYAPNIYDGQTFPVDLSMTSDSTSMDEQSVMSVYEMQCQAGVFLAGFRDCTEEAVRYLIEVENLHEDDPLIQGLKFHLTDHQQHMDVTHVMSDTENGSHFYSRSRLPSESAQETNQTELNDSGISECLEKCSNEIHEQDMVQDDSFTSVVVDSQNNMLTPEVQLGFTECITEKCANVNTSQSLDVSDLDQHFAHLVRNNSAVASLTQELFDLLAEPETDDEDDMFDDMSQSCISEDEDF